MAGRRRSGELTTLVTHGLDGLDVSFARFLPQLALALLVPLVVLVRIGPADWPSAVILAVTAPLIPVFMALIGRYTRSRTARQWGLLAGLGGHFLHVVEGLPTLKVFGRAEAQVGVIRRVTERYRLATMATMATMATLATLRVAFTSALVMALLATLGTALVAVAVGLRLLYGGMSYSSALLVLLLAPEVYLPLRALGGSFHTGTEGVAAATQAYAVLDEAVPGAVPVAAARKAGLLDWVRSLSEGWSTQVGHRRVRISGGEWQRLALARALPADPQVLVLDEPTAHLDRQLLGYALDDPDRDARPHHRPGDPRPVRARADGRDPGPGRRPRGPARRARATARPPPGSTGRCGRSTGRPRTSTTGARRSLRRPAPRRR